VIWKRSRAWVRDGLLIAGATLISMAAIAIFCQASFHEFPYVYVIVDRGISFSEIARRFQDQGMIKEKDVFLALGRLLRIEHRAKAGRYRLPATSSMIEILETLYRGATYREKVVVAPGKTIETISRLLCQRAAVDSTRFSGLARDSALVTALGVPSTNAEGYLYPETYEIEWGEDAESILKRMVSNFLRVFNDSLRSRAESLGMSINEVMTLASIIEMEAMLDTERPHISAVFHNRLRLGMKLQADPTVRYALNKWGGPVLYRDLKVESPFNTYWAHGLPPHPICSPGPASIMAALYPLPASRDLYFVAQGDGSHYFSETAGEHSRAKARYKDYIKSLNSGGQDEAQADQ
jgi:UPF0755 protein